MATAVSQLVSKSTCRNLWVSDVSETLAGMGNTIGYARVSTTVQEPALQLDALDRAGAIRTFVDHASGATMARPQLDAALDFLRPGDTLAVWRLDRLGRSLRDLIDQVNKLGERGVGFASLTEGIDTSTSAGRMVFHIFGAISEFERELVRERTVAGLDAARARGRRGGRPPVLTRQRVEAAAALREQGQTLDEVAAALQVSRSSVARALARQRAGG